MIARTARPPHTSDMSLAIMFLRAFHAYHCARLLQLACPHMRITSTANAATTIEHPRSSALDINGAPHDAAARRALFAEQRPLL